MLLRSALVDAKFLVVHALVPVSVIVLGDLLVNFVTKRFATQSIVFVEFLTLRIVNVTAMRVGQE